MNMWVDQEVCNLMIKDAFILYHIIYDYEAFTGTKNL